MKGHPKKTDQSLEAFPKAGYFSSGLRRYSRLSGLLRAVPVFRPDASIASELTYIVGWGLKSNTRTATAYASKHALPYLTLEDGFLRSVGLGISGDPPLSMVLDDQGIYYDATRPSRLESLIRNGRDTGPLGRGLPTMDDAAARARACIDHIVRARLSKYNGAPEVELPPTERARVLVVDQTAGDLSIEYGLADADRFGKMLERAIAENPGAEILVKTHPDVVAGKKHGHLTELARNRGLTLLSEDMNPIRLLEQVDRVYVVTSQLGFEALMVGKPVSCFGAPFYAGWGLTDDRTEIPRRGMQRSLEQIFAAAYIIYPRYIDPDSGQPCEIERVIEHLALQRRYFSENRGRLQCLGFTLWKRNYVREYLRSPANRIEFSGRLRAARKKPEGAAESPRVVIWASKETPRLRAEALRSGTEIWRIEDGFIRSPGLGSDLTPPASLVVDRTGIYYDPNRPSDLESTLQQSEFPPGLIRRARMLRQRIVAGRISKYNVGARAPLRIHAANNQRKILIPGQVEDDASIRLGCRDVRTNAELIRQVRRANPDAYLLYKPHPDVVSGNRRGGVDRDTLALCDQVIAEAGLVACLEAVDEVHTLTSLVGFEALMRGLAVHTYGLPFYAGWGLTRDRHSLERRCRMLTLDELVAGTLILYPRYVNPETGRFTSAEAIVEWLERRAAESARTEIRLFWARRQLRKLRNLYRGLVR